MDGFGPDMWVMKKLTCSEEVREEAVIVQTPYAVRSSWFEEVKDLYSASKSEISS